jgi:glycosyltransferase involved in cell wall biosynthesis
VITLLVMTDGRREYLPRTLASMQEMVTGPITRRVIHDDSGDPTYWAWLADMYPAYTVIRTSGRAGFGGAIRSAWQYLRDIDTEDYVLHLEDDFLFHRPVDLADMVTVLDEQPHLAQLALRRQPWNDPERRAGGLVQQHPEAYREVTDPVGRTWLEHRMFFTTNPSLYRRSLCWLAWPEGNQSEGHFGWRLFHDQPSLLSGRRSWSAWQDSTGMIPPEDLRCAFWGSRDSGEWVEHIGHRRTGTGY